MQVDQLNIAVIGAGIAGLTTALALQRRGARVTVFEQAEQLFMTLLRRGVDVAMVRFPGESHELSRGGSPKHRVERFEHILDWHGAHLG